MIEFVFVAFLFPSGILAQEKQPIQYKLYRTEELIKIDNPDPAQRHRLEILTNKKNAKHMGGIFVILSSAAPEAKATFHYHKSRASIPMILSGKGMELVEGNAILIKGGDVIFIPPQRETYDLEHFR